MEARNMNATTNTAARNSLPFAACARWHRAAYHTARERAAYYLWAALRGHALPGHDPISGRERSAMNAADRAESRAAYKALYLHARNAAATMAAGW
jgi:hypothetical protein